jgi:hypothetical protein
MGIPPIFSNKYTSMPSVFAPAALLREARRQKGLDTLEVPSVCILDPDGDLVRLLRQAGRAKPFAGCGDDPASDYRLIHSVPSQGAPDTIRLCDDCRMIRERSGESSVSLAE